MNAAPFVRGRTNSPSAVRAAYPAHTALILRKTFCGHRNSSLYILTLFISYVKRKKAIFSKINALFKLPASCLLLSASYFLPYLYSLIFSASPIGIFRILRYCSDPITKYELTPIASIFPYVAGATKKVSQPCILAMNSP